MKSTSATRDVSAKPPTLRAARAAARLKAGPATIRALKEGRLPKADPVGVAKVAGIQAAKETSRIIPFCHNVPLDGISVSIEAGRSWIDIETAVVAVWKTGVEMEALVAASAAALTLYDMLKPVDDSLEIVSVRLTHKSGGTSGRTGGAGARKAAQARGRGRARLPGAGIRAAIVVVSDTVSSGKGRDATGRTLAEGLKVLGASVRAVKAVPDERTVIAREIRKLSDAARTDLVIAAGGTGVGPRDVTAEAVADLIDRRLHGVENAFLLHGQQRLPTAMLSRCVAGTRKGSVVLALPGSPGAARDALDALFPALFHAFPVMRGGDHR